MYIRTLTELLSRVNKTQIRLANGIHQCIEQLACPNQRQRCQDSHHPNRCDVEDFSTVRCWSHLSTTHSYFDLLNLLERWGVRGIRHGKNIHDVNVINNVTFPLHCDRPSLIKEFLRIHPFRSGQFPPGAMGNISAS